MSSPNAPAIRGLLRLEDSYSEFNATAAIFRSMLSRVATSTLVQVKKVTNDGGLAPVGFVDVQPMVNQVDGDGIAVPHGIIPNVPYSRLQGGANAVILDPEVGDIGVAVFASRSIASVIANRAPSNPSGNGRFRWSDALYVGGMLNGTPTQYMRFSLAGIEILSPTQVKIEAPDIQISCATLEIVATTSASITTPTWTVNGDQVSNGNVTASGIVAAAEVDAPIVTVDTTLTVAGKSLGPSHEHHLSTGTTGGVV